VTGDHRFDDLNLSRDIGFIGWSVPGDLNSIITGCCHCASMDRLPKLVCLPFGDDPDELL